MNFFLEFKGENEYLFTINEILQNLRKYKLVDLVNVYQDIGLTREYTKFLLDRNEKEKIKNEELINECAKMSDKCSKMSDQCITMTKQINELKIELNLLVLN